MDDLPSLFPASDQHSLTVFPDFASAIKSPGSGNLRSNSVNRSYTNVFAALSGRFYANSAPLKQLHQSTFDAVEP